MSSHELIPYLTVSLFFSFSAAFGFLAMGMGFTKGKVGVIKGLGILDDFEESEDEDEVVVVEEVKEKRRKVRKQKSWDGVKVVEEPLPTISPTLTLKLSRLSPITKTYTPHRLTMQHLPHSSPSSTSSCSSGSRPLTSLSLTRPLSSSSSSPLTFLTSHPSLLASITTTSDSEGMEEMRKWIEWEMNVALTLRTAIPRRRVLGIWVSEEEEEADEGKTVILIFENWGTSLPASSWSEVPLSMKKKILTPSLHLLALGLDVCSLKTENVLIRTDEDGKVLEVRFRELQGLPRFEAGLERIEGWRECIEKVEEWKERLGVGEEDE